MPQHQTIRVTTAAPSLWGRVRNAARSLTLTGLHLKDRELARKMAWNGEPTAAGITVSEETALTYAAVWQAVTLIAGDIASLPLILYKRSQDGGKTRYTDHPLYELLHTAPNPEMSSMSVRETLQAHALTWGNGYAEIERDGAARPMALWPLIPTQVQPHRDERGRLTYRVRNPSGSDVELDPANMVHIHGLGFDGTTGYSVIHQARQSLGLLAASERFGATFFGNGTTFGGALKHPKVLGTEGAKNLRESITKYHQGPDKAHRFLILEEGMDFVRFGIEPNDAQFLETRQFQIAEVARWFNLPLHKLREMEHSSVRANIEQEALDYYVATLRPWLVRWEQELNRKLISSRERKIQFVEHNLDGVLRGDLKSRYDAYAVGRQWGWLSQNEIRALENLGPIADGNTYLSPMNMMPSDRLQEMIDAQVRPPAPQTPLADDSEDDEDEQDDEASALRVRIVELETAAAVLQERAERYAQAANAAETAARDAAAAEARAVAEWKPRAEHAEATRVAAEAARAAAAAETLAAEAARRAAEARAEADAAAALEARAMAAAAEQARDTSDRSLREAVARAERSEAERAALATRATESEARAETLQASLDVAQALAAGAASDRDAALAAAARAEAEVAAAEAALADLDAAHRAHGEATAAERAAAEAAIETSRRARDEALAEAATARAASEAAATRAEQAASSLTAAQAERDAALAQLTAAHAAQSAQAQAHTEHLSAVITAHRAVLVEAVQRLVRREADKARSKRATPAKLRQWAAAFYAEHEAALWVEMLRPVVALHQTLVGAPEDADAATRALVDHHFAESKRQILAVADADPEDYDAGLTRVVTRWEESRADTIADAFIRQEIAHVCEK